MQDLPELARGVPLCFLCCLCIRTHLCFGHFLFFFVFLCLSLYLCNSLYLFNCLRILLCFGFFLYDSATSTWSTNTLYKALMQVRTTDRVVELYKESGRTVLVARGQIAADGEAVLQAQGSSGITGYVTVDFSAEDTGWDVEVDSPSPTLDERLAG